MPPPKTNFEALQDILSQRKGMTLDVSTSGALAKSLDACVVSVANFCACGSTDGSVPRVTRVQHACEDHGNALYAERRVFLLWIRVQGNVWALWSRQSNLHPFHCKSHSDLKGSAADDLQSPIRRYADVLAHRQLAAAIAHTPLHPALQSKSHLERTLNVVTRRHRLAQMAGRASVEFSVGLALKSRGEARGESDGRTREEAFVIRTFRNGLAVFVSS
jgi:exosome complex exonuclease DIS3/RRP44